MRVAIAIILLFTLNPIRVSHINSFKEDAEVAFNKGDYTDAVNKFKYLIDTLKADDPALILNFAHAQLLSEDTLAAVALYQSLMKDGPATLRSKAWLQMGVIKNKQGNPEEALSHFKEAIKADRNNADARYNYELLKKYIDYPEIILERIRLLVSKRQYKASRDFLEEKMKNNRRIEEFSDYQKRIGTIITIDSLGHL